MTRETEGIVGVYFGDLRFIVKVVFFLIETFLFLLILLYDIEAKLFVLR